MIASSRTMLLRASIRRCNVMLMLLACMACAGGCGKPSIRTYEGPERPPSETVTIQNRPMEMGSLGHSFWSYLILISVDDQKISTWNWNDVIVSPGAHWYQARVFRLIKVSLLIGGLMSFEATCGFRLEAAPGTIYRLKTFDNDGPLPDNVSKLYKASLEVEERLAGGDFGTHRIPVVCVQLDINPFYDDRKAKGGVLCRGNQDCLMEGEVCNVDAEFSLGVCGKP